MLRSMPARSSLGSRKSKSVRRRAGQIMESLEHRRLMTVMYSAVNGVSLNGTNGSDVYGVRLVEVSTGDYVEVTEGVGGVHKFPVATQPVSRISANLLDGPDSVILEATLNIPLFASGGLGNDTITGGAAGDTISGGDENDLLTGNGGNDGIQGGNDNDTITGDDGNDTLGGQSGLDFIHGNVGDDLITGDSDNDFLYGDEDEDTISGGDDSDDLIHGGTEDDSLDGNDGNDTVNGDEGNDVIHGNDGNDSLSGGLGTDSIFGDADNDSLFGNDGDDTLRGGTQHDFLDGGLHNDSLLGESGADQLWGRDDNDTLDGGSENDTVRGEGGDDSILAGTGNDDADGGSGKDTLNGDAGADTVHGGAGDDLVRGGADDDLVYGDGENDSVYGGSGTDTLLGGSGRDGLFGGADGLEDSVSGGSGNDRFLNKYTGGSVLFQNWEDKVNDKTNDDARIGFKNGNALNNVSFAGQNGTYSYAAGTWTDAEIESVDVGLSILHNATLNKELLEQKHGNEIEMLRQGAQTSASGGSFNAAAWNDGGQIRVAAVSIQTILHEIGHHWDREYDKDGWWALSGWVKTPSDTTGLTQALDASGDYWYGNTAQFVSTYATTNPDEDFADSFSYYFMNLGGLTFTGGTLNINSIVGKNSFFDQMVIDLA